MAPRKPSPRGRVQHRHRQQVLEDHQRAVRHDAAARRLGPPERLVGSERGDRDIDQAGIEQRLQDLDARRRRLQLDRAHRDEEGGGDELAAPHALERRVPPQRRLCIRNVCVSAAPTDSIDVPRLRLPTPQAQPL